MGEAKQRHDDARDMVDMIDRLIDLRIHRAMVDANSSQEDIEVLKREMTDYLLVTDPRRGVYVRGEHG